MKHINKAIANLNTATFDIDVKINKLTRENNDILNSTISNCGDAKRPLTTVEKLKIAENESTIRNLESMKYDLLDALQILHKHE